MVREDTDENTPPSYADATAHGDTFRLEPVPHVSEMGYDSAADNVTRIAQYIGDQLPREATARTVDNVTYVEISGDAFPALRRPPSVIGGQNMQITARRPCERCSGWWCRILTVAVSPPDDGSITKDAYYLSLMSEIERDLQGSHFCTPDTEIFISGCLFSPCVSEFAQFLWLKVMEAEQYGVMSAAVFC